MSQFKPGSRVVHRLTGQKMLVTSEMVSDKAVYVVSVDPDGRRLSDVVGVVELEPDRDPSGVHEALEAARERAVVAQDFELAAAIRTVIENHLKRGAGK